MKQLNEDVRLIKTTGYIYYTKWIATFIILMAVACRSVEEIPKVYDVFFSWIGTGLWLVVSIAWKDRALILLNSVISFMLFLAILRHIF
tara:strand:- start:641 stop:907 length:267 start_codon:yes stop_codon:yes gene_type:complete